MNKEKLEQNIDKMQKELDLMKEQLKEADKPKLRLEIVEDGDLQIMYKDDMIGFICDRGKCFILSEVEYIEIYEQWRKDGMPIDTESIVKWRNGDYQLTRAVMLKRIDILSGLIYDFDACICVESCEDDNIKRHKHNNRPVGF